MNNHLDYNYACHLCHANIGISFNTKIVLFTFSLTLVKAYEQLPLKLITSCVTANMGIFFNTSTITKIAFHTN